MGRGHRRKNTKERRQSDNILVVCDGETEENYVRFVLKEYISKKELPTSITIKKFDNIKSTEKFIQRKPGSPPFDAVVFLKDLENTNLNNEECCNLRNHEKLSGKRRDNSFWFIFYNYPSIEYWYLLHFTKCARGFNNASDAIKKLKNYYHEYKKPMPENIVQGEKLVKRVDIAMENIKTLNVLNTLKYSDQITSSRNLTNPMSDMNIFIELLLSSRKEYKNIYQVNC